MTKPRTQEQILHILREVKRGQDGGLPIRDVLRKLGVAEKTYYRWRDRYGADTRDGARQLEAEVDRLKLLVAELLLDKQVLQEAAKKKW